MSDLLVKASRVRVRNPPKFPSCANLAQLIRKRHLVSLRGLNTLAAIISPWISLLADLKGSVRSDPGPPFLRHCSIYLAVFAG